MGSKVQVVADLYRHHLEHRLRSCAYVLHDEVFSESCTAHFVDHSMVQQSHPRTQYPGTKGPTMRLFSFYRIGTKINR